MFKKGSVWKFKNFPSDQRTFSLLDIYHNEDKIMMRFKEEGSFDCFDIDSSEMEIVETTFEERLLNTLTDICHALTTSVSYQIKQLEENEEETDEECSCECEKCESNKPEYEPN